MDSRWRNAYDAQATEKDCEGDIKERRSIHQIQAHVHTQMHRHSSAWVSIVRIDQEKKEITKF